MQAFYWMMNQTNYVTEYYTDADYRRHSSAGGARAPVDVTLMVAAMVAAAAMRTLLRFA